MSVAKQTLAMVMESGIIYQQELINIILVVLEVLYLIMLQVMRVEVKL